MATLVRQQESAKLVFRRLQEGGLSNLIHIALIESNLAKLLLVGFDNKERIKQGILMASILLRYFNARLGSFITEISSSLQWKPLIQTVSQKCIFFKQTSKELSQSTHSSLKSGEYNKPKQIY